MENQAMNVVTEFLTAVQKGNTVKLGALLHPEVKWSQPGDNVVSGFKSNADEVFQMVGQMFELSSNTLALTEIKVLAENGNSIACLVHWKAKRPNGQVLDIDNIDVYTVGNGLINNVVVYTEDIDVENEFWRR
jgi:ketosteroid isomerase-like protein